jgi:hypothetical protein
MFSLRCAIEDHNVVKVIDLLDSIPFTDRDLEFATLLVLEERSEIMLNELLKHGATAYEPIPILNK